jgi:hypothetical protein
MALIYKCVVFSECSALALVTEASYKPVEFYTRNGGCRGYDLYRSHYNAAFGPELFLDEPKHGSASYIRGGQSPCHPEGSFYSRVNNVYIYIMLTSFSNIRHVSQHNIKYL